MDPPRHQSCGCLLTIGSAMLTLYDCLAEPDMSYVMNHGIVFPAQVPLTGFTFLSKQTSHCIKACLEFILLLQRVSHYVLGSRTDGKIFV